MRFDAKHQGYVVGLHAIKFVVDVAQQRRSQVRALIVRARAAVEWGGEMIVSHKQ